MKNLLLSLLFVSVISVSTQAQNRDIELYGVFVSGSSFNSGNGPEFGGGVQAFLIHDNLFRDRDLELTARGLIFSKPKVYVGDGWGVHTTSTARFSVINRVYVEGGISYSKVWTSQYSKTATNPIVGIGVTADGYRIGYNYYVTDKTKFDTAASNDTRGHVLYYEYHGQPWFARTEVGIWQYQQPVGYSNQGSHTAVNIKTTIGLKIR